MQRQELAKGIWLNQLSARLCTITSTLPNAAPDWRVSYFGFDKWHEATRFVFRLKRLRDTVRCEARKAQRLSTPYEVKVWTLSKEEVQLLWSELEGHALTFRPSNRGTVIDLCLNGQRVIGIHPTDKEYAEEFVQRLHGLSHTLARRAIVDRFLGQVQA